MKFSSNRIKNIAVGGWLQIKRCWVTYTLEKENWISSDIFWPEAFFFSFDRENKDNFGSVLLRIWRRHQGQHIASNLICYFQTVFPDPLLLEDGAVRCLKWTTHASLLHNPIREVMPGAQKGSHDCGGRQPLVWPRFSVYKIYVFTVAKP